MQASAATGSVQPIPRLEDPLPVKIWRGVSNPLRFLTELEAQFGDIVTLREGRSVAVFHPDYIRHVLQDNHPNYQKGPRYRAALAPLMGNGLFTSEGSFWLRQRRLAQPAFQRHHLEGFGGPALDCMAEMFRAWTKKANHGQPIALREELTELTLRIALRNLFGTDADGELNTLIPAINEVNDQIKLASTFLPIHMPKWAPTPKRLRFRAGLRVIDAFIYRIIQERRAKPGGQSDIVALLLRARDDETGEQMDDLQLRDELVTMLNAGHDTVTDAIGWTMVLLAQHPECRAQVRQEVARVLGGKRPTPQTLTEMPLLGRVFHESLRLHPPAWAFARTSIEEDQIGPYRIPAGILVIISPYVLHHSPRFWERPGVFDPDRFLPERSDHRHKYAFLPFGTGPRKCIGAGLVAIEAPLVLAAILQKFDFELKDKMEVRPDPRISLRPKGTVWLKLKPVSRD